MCHFSRNGWHLLWCHDYVQTTNIDNGHFEPPTYFSVKPNYPNPFNPSTVIDIETIEASDLMVSVFDAKGRMVNNLVNSYLEAGRYSVKWNGMDASGMSMPTGVYFIRVQSGIDMHTQKMILIK